MVEQKLAALRDLIVSYCRENQDVLIQSVDINSERSIFTVLEPAVDGAEDQNPKIAKYEFVNQPKEEGK